jgi:hypothetical protein
LGNRRQGKQNGAPGSKKGGGAGGNSGGNGSDLTRREAAEYIAGLLDGLKLIAHEAGLPFIAYLLAMASEEARVEKSRGVRRRSLAATHQRHQLLAVTL